MGDDGQHLFPGWDDYQDMVRAGAGLLELSAYQGRGVMLTQGEDTEAVLANPVTPDFFRFLGVKAALGRAAVDSTAGRPGFVMGHRLWLRRFGADPQVVGKTVLLNGQALVVNGVMPANFTGLERVVAIDVFVGMDTWFDVLGHSEEKRGRSGQFEFVARLKPGVTPERAAAVLDAAIRGPGKHKPAPARSAGTWLEGRFSPGWKSGLLYGGGLALVLGLVLFVACVNVAQLRLAQAETRRKELGVYIALGAGPRHVVGRLLTETGLVSAAGCTLGLLLAKLFIGRVTAFVAASGLPVDLRLGLDYRVLTFTLLAATASVFLAGLAPARFAVRLDVAEVFKSGQGFAGAHGARQRKAFMVGQMAVTVMLFGVALLFLQSFRNAAAIHPGLDPRKKLLVLMVGPGWESRITLWCEQACARLAGLPGVRAATFARRLPLADSGGGARVRVEMPGRAPIGVGFNNVAGNYFSMMGTHVLAGRAIDANDREGGPLVVVASQRFAAQVFGGRNPLGEWISVDGRMRQIVGIAEDAPSNDLHEAPAPFLYLPFAQFSPGDITLLVETAGEPERLERAVRHELKQFDSRMTVYETITLRQHMEHALLYDRFMAGLSTSMGMIGLLLTSAGLFAAIQYAVNRRTREIGVRVALGARPSEIQRMVLGESLRMAVWGIAIGLVLLAVAAWYARSAVLGVHPLNPTAYLTSSVAAVVLASLAAWWPAMRAARVDPNAALHME